MRSSLASLPQITGNSPNVCAKSHVAKRDRDGEKQGEAEKRGREGAQGARHRKWRKMKRPETIRCTTRG